MPCDTITKMEVATHKMRREYLISALEKLGYTVTERGDKIHWGYNREFYNTKTGELSVIEGTVEKYKKAYSQTIVEKSMKQIGWKMKNVSKTGAYVYVKN